MRPAPGGARLRAQRRTASPVAFVRTEKSPAPGKAGRKVTATAALVGSAAALAGAGITAWMLPGSMSPAAAPAGQGDIQSATLTGVTTSGTGTVDNNAGFVTPPAPVPSTPSLNGSPAPKTIPVIPGVTPDTASSANNPGGNSFPFLPLTTQTGIAPTPSGLALSPSTSNNDPLGFGNVGIAPAGRITFNDDGSTIINPGGVLAISTPLGGGSAPFGFPVTIDANGNAKFTAWDNFVSGLVNLPDLKNTTNTTGFASDQPANPNFDTNAPFGSTSFVDPFTKQTFDNVASIVNAAQANDVANAANSLSVPTMQQLFPNGFPGDATVGDAGAPLTRGIIITPQVPVVYPDGSTSYFDSGTTVPQFVPQGSTVGGTTYGTPGGYSGPKGEPIIVTPASPPAPESAPPPAPTPNPTPGKTDTATGDDNGGQKVATTTTTTTDSDPGDGNTPPPPPAQPPAAPPTTSGGSTGDPQDAPPPAPVVNPVATNYDPTSFGNTGGDDFG